MTTMRTTWLLLCSVLVLSSLAVAETASGAVTLVRLPAGAVSPSVALQRGVVHIVYGKDGSVYYQHSTSSSYAFSKPVKLNASSTAETAGERGPRICAGRRGALHVVWIGKPATTVWYTRIDPTRGAAPERNLLERGDADGVTVAADTAGHVTVSWIDPRRGEDPEAPVSKVIFAALSSDDGRTFGPNTEVPGLGHARACACCTTTSAYDAPGRLLIAYRGAYHSIRDIYLLRDGRAQDISNDGWKFDGCPMSGPFLDIQAASGARREPAPAPALLAWMSDGQVYFGAPGQPRTSPQAATTSARNYPLVLRNARNEILFAWVEAGKVRWELRSPAGQVVASQDNPAPEVKTRPTAFVSPSDNATFVLVY